MPEALSRAGLEYDVIVVGGGPAGGSAAYFLGEAGLRVLVLEKDRLPRYKTCGGGLSTRFLRAQFPFSFEPILRTEVNAISYTYREKTFSIPLRPDSIGMVMRSELDAYLLEHTRAEVIQGAAVCGVREENDRVTVETRDGQRYAAAYLVGADGANSVVAHALGLRSGRVLGAAVEVEVQVLPEVMRALAQRPVFIFGELSSGYLWIFPKPDHLSVGAAAYRPKPGQLQETLARVMQRYGISLENAVIHGHPIPIYTRREPVATARTLLVGDAAGLADPLSGEGIRFAVKSGKIAAGAILSGQVGGYAEALYRAIGFHHRMTLLIARIFYRIPGLMLSLGAPNPFSTQAVVDMLADRISMAEFVLWAILTLPLFHLTELAARLVSILGFPRQAARIRAWVYPDDIRL